MGIRGRRDVLVAGALLSLASTLQAQTTYTFSTLAGSAGSVVRSIDATGSAAQFYAPRGVAVDSSGNVYVADSSNNTIRKVTAAGVVTTFAGTAGSQGTTDGTGAAARFIDPYGVAIDSAGNLYVADTSGNKIRRLTPAGVVTTLAGNGGSGSADGTGAAANFAEPRGVAVDSAGNVYVADFMNHVVRKVTPAGVVTTLAGSAGTPGSSDGTGTAAKFRGLAGVAVDAAGNVYVADTDNHAIRKITPAGVVTTLAGQAGSSGGTDGTGTAARFSQPRGISVDGTGTLYVSDYGGHTIRKVTAAGLVTTIAGVSGTPGPTDATGTAARFYAPSGLAVDSGGSIYVADTSNNTIRKISSSAAVTTLAGLAGRSSSADGTGAAARFEDPYAVAVDAGGNLYVADATDHTVRKVTAAGVVTTLAGSAGSFGSADGTGSAARFFAPLGIAVDSSGNVFLSDTGNFTVRKITPAGVVSTLAGSAGQRGASDGTGTAARFSSLNGLTVDASGNVFVIDNAAVRKITPAGAVTTFAGGTNGFTDGTGTAARFLVPFDITIDGSGNLYVCDHGNHAIRKITPAGVVTTLAGNGTAGNTDATGTSARFRFPSGVAAEASGIVFVADTDNQVIRRIGTDGAVTTVGGGGSPGSTDGVGTSARFFNPKDVAVDSSGNLYVADRGNYAIRKGAASSTGTATRLANIATRGPVFTGDNVMIGGFIIQGSSPKKVLVTARGPSMAAQGVSGTLADPFLTLYSGATPIASNDDFGTAANAGEIPESMKPGNAKEAAILRTLYPGAYTAIVTGVGGTTGIAIVEAFEVDKPESPLINIATRAPVLTGDNVMIGGFIIQGDGPKTVLVTARGPSLAAQGVPGVLANPTLALYSGQSVIASNDDWGTNANAAAIQATGQGPSNAKEAALLLTLNPGAYTAIVTGAGGTTGIGIVEVFAR